MANFDGSTICGKRGGKPFTETLRPTLDGACPSGTVPCSFNTSPENTICMSPEEKGLCPVTEIKLMNKTQAEVLDPEIYQTIDFKNDTVIVYSKTHLDNLPIKST